MVLLATGSLGLSIWGIHAQPFATFFLLPTRAWEILLGAILALSVRARPFSKTISETMIFLGLALISIPLFLYDQHTPFPGATALVPCLGTCLIISALSSEKKGARTLASRILSWSPLCFCGRISYSLYLWHWPIICFSSYWSVKVLPLSTRLALIIGTFALAILSYYYVEQPIRRKRRLATLKQLVLAHIGATGVLLFVSIFLILTGGFPSRLKPEVMGVVEQLERDHEIRVEFQNNQARNIDDMSLITEDRLPRIGVLNNGERAHFAILGDSHAREAGPIFDEIAREFSLSGVMITYTGTPPLLEWNTQLPWAHPDPALLWETALHYIKANNIKTVFLSAYWSDHSTHVQETEYIALIRNTLEQYSAAGVSVYFMHDAPVYDFSVPRSIVREAYFGGLIPEPKRQSQQEHLSKHEVITHALEQYDKSLILDPSLSLLDKGKEFFVTANNQGLSLYRDDDHLSQTGYRHAWEGILKEVLRNMQQ